MGKIVASTNVANLEDDDYFEEFDLDMQKMDTKEEDGEEDEIFGEAEKWDDDDIEEDFATILKSELKIADQADDFEIDVITKQEVATCEAKRLKKKNRTDALAAKEMELLAKEKELDQRKKMYAVYTLDPLSMEEQKKKDEKKKASSKNKKKDAKKPETAADKYFKPLTDATTWDFTYDECKDDFADDIKQLVSKHKGVILSQQRDNLSEKEKELKRKEKYLNANAERFLKVRHNHAAKMLPATADDAEVNKKEEEELLKAVAARQDKRRRAGILICHHRATNMTNCTEEDMAKLLMQMAVDVANAEGLEEKELLKPYITEGRPGTAGKKCLPYKAEKGDALDEAVGAVLTGAKYESGFKLIKRSPRKAENTREYVTRAGIVKVKHVYNLVLSQSETGPWAPLTEFLQSK